MRIRLFPALIALTLLALIATACSVAQGAQPGPSLAPELTRIASAAAQTEASVIALPPETRSDTAGAVTVEVTPAGGTTATLIFDVTMNTHTVELDYDMTKIATLMDDQGRAYPVKSWNGAAGGHHREGSLTFEAPAGATPKSLQLNLAGIGGVPDRLFQWTVK
jgi:hypothetical protein